MKSNLPQPPASTESLQVCLNHSDVCRELVWGSGGSECIHSAGSVYSRRDGGAHQRQQCCWVQHLSVINTAGKHEELTDLLAVCSANGRFQYLERKPADFQVSRGRDPAGGRGPDVWASFLSGLCPNQVQLWVNSHTKSHFPSGSVIFQVQLAPTEIFGIQ